MSLIDYIDVCLMNSRSLVNKLNKFQSFTLSSKSRILAVTETWLSDRILDNEIIPAGFNIYRNDRPSRGGGVLIAVDRSLPSRPLAVPFGHEVVTVEVKCPHVVILCVVYIPPGATFTHLQVLLRYIQSLLTCERLVLLGDFNQPNIDWQTLTGNCPVSNSLCDFIFDHGLVQLIHEPTHVQGNILDLATSNQ